MKTAGSIGKTKKAQNTTANYYTFKTNMKKEKDMELADLEFDYELAVHNLILEKGNKEEIERENKIFKDVVKIIYSISENEKQTEIYEILKKYDEKIGNGWSLDINERALREILKYIIK